MSNLYAERDIIEQGKHYSQHTSAMTGEGLHSKSDIAAELAHRDIEIERLQARVSELEAEEEGAKEAFGVIVDKMKDIQSRNLQIEKTIHRQVIEISRLYRSGARPLSNDADKAGGDL